MRYLTQNLKKVLKNVEMSILTIIFINEFVNGVKFKFSNLLKVLNFNTNKCKNIYFLHLYTIKHRCNLR